MAGMKRFVTYIYSYEDKKKGSNIGFAKIEIRGEDCRIEIHLRGVYAAQAACSVYLFRENAGDMEGSLIGTMRLGNGNGDFGTIVKAAKIGDTPYGIADMEGILLLSEDERIFMSRWKEGKPLEVGREHFRIWQRQDSDASMEQAVTAAGTEQTAKAAAAEGAVTRARQTTAAAVTKRAGMDITSRSGNGAKKKPDEAMGEEENVQATEVPMRNMFPEYDWIAIWETLQQSHPLFHPFENEAVECIQIELKTLRELPKRYWYLGNNSFLLHGFFNYRYIVIGKTEERRWFIGVPGIYQRQERVMAAIFGFPEFIAAAAPGTQTDGGEPVNRFGCWYRFIEE